LHFWSDSVVSSGIAQPKKCFELAPLALSHLMCTEDEHPQVWVEMITRHIVMIVGRMGRLFKGWEEELLFLKRDAQMHKRAETLAYRPFGCLL
jgi:hypothetical protein